MATQSEILQFVLQILGQDSVDKLKAAMDAASKSADGLSVPAKEAAAEIDRLTTQAGKIEGFAALKAQTTEVGLKLTAAKAGLAALGTEFDRTDTSSAKVTRAFAQAEQQVASLTLQHNSLSAQLTRSGADLERSGVSTKNLAGAHAELATKIAVSAQNFESLVAKGNNTRGVFSELGSLAVSFGEGIKQAGEHVLEFGKHLAEISGIAGLIATALAAISGERFFEKGIEDASSFQQSLTKAGIAVNATSEDLEHLKEAAEAAGEATGQGGAAAAAALAILAKGAGSAQAAIAELTPTLVLAKAAQIDVAQAADIVGTAIAQFGLQATDAARVTDILAKTAGIAKTDLNELSAGFAKVAPDAKAAGVTIEQTAALFAALSDNGIRGKKATTDLSSAFQEFANPTSKLNQELLGLGLSGLSLVDVLKKVSGNSEATARIVDALGTKGGSAFRALAGSIPDLRRVSAELENAAGSAQSAADKFDHTLSGAFKRFGASFDDLAGKLVEPVLEPLSNGFLKLSQVVTDFTKTANFAKIRDAVLAFVNGSIEGITRFVTKLGSGMDESATSIANFVTHAGESFKSFTEGVSVIGRVASGIGNTVGLVFNTLVGVIQNGVANIARGIEYGEVAYLGLAKIRGATEKEIAILKGQIEAAKQTADDLEAKSKASFDAASKNIENLGVAIAGSGDEVEKAAPKLEAHIEKLSLIGRITQGVAAAYREFRAAVDPAIPSVVKLTEAQVSAAAAAGNLTARNELLKASFSALHITSQKDLDDLAETARIAFEKIDKASDNTAKQLADKRNAFLAYAKAQLAATQNLDQAAQDSARINLESKASVLGVADALKRLEEQSDSATAAVVDDSRKRADALTQELLAAERRNAANHNAGVQSEIAGQKAAEAADKAEKGYTEWGDAADAAALATQHITADTSHANDGMKALTQGIADARAEFLQTSDAAAKFYDTVLKGNFDIGHSDDGSGFDRVARAMQAALTATRDEIAANRDEVQSLVTEVSKFGTESVEDFSKFGQVAEHIGDRTIPQMITAIKDGTFSVGLLGQQDLGPLLDALQAAQQRVDSLKAAARSATQAIADLGQQLQDERDQQLGNDEDIENRRYAKQVKDIQDLAAQADAAGKAQAQKDLELAKQIHDQKIKDIEDQKKKASQQSQQSSGGNDSSSSSSGGGTTSSSDSGSTGGSSSATVTHKVELSLSGAGWDNLSNLSTDQIHDLTYQITQALIREKGRTR